MNLNFNILNDTNKEIEEMIIGKMGANFDLNYYELINNYNQAYEYAFEYFFDYEEFEGYSWNDIIDENMSKVRGILYNDNNYQMYTKQLREIVIPSITFDKYFSDTNVRMEIESEIELCAKARLVCGYDNYFFELLFKAYKLGGWPCGWHQGKMIVFVHS